MSQQQQQEPKEVQYKRKELDTVEGRIIEAESQLSIASHLQLTRLCPNQKQDHLKDLRKQTAILEGRLIESEHQIADNPSPDQKRTELAKLKSQKIILEQELNSLLRKIQHC